MSKTQALLKRNNTMTQQQFSDHWYSKHAAIVLPYFLSYGFQYYAQIHAPLQTSNPELQTEIKDWDGAAELIPPANPSPNPEPQWKKDYYREVVLIDERRFLVSEALQHVRFVEEGSVSGERRVVIRDGKPCIDVPDDGEVMRVWREYEARGNGEEEGR